MKERDLADGQVNQMIGTALGIGFIAPKQFLWCGIIFLICVPLIIKNPLQGLLIFAGMYGIFWIITGNDPNEFFERFSKPKKYLAEEPVFEFNAAEMPIPEKTNRHSLDLKIKGKKQTLHYIEKKFLLQTLGQIELDNREVGFYLLRRGPQLMFIFGWEVEGHDPSMTENQSLAILSACNDALNQLPGDIDLKCYQEISRCCEDYLKKQAQLLIGKKQDPLSEALIKSRAKRGKELASQGRLLNNKITIFAKYRVELGGDYAIKQTWLDEVLSKTQPLINMIQGKGIEEKKSWEKVIDYAYYYAYSKVNSLLQANSGLGMKVRTLTVDKLWERDYRELHTGAVPPVPQYIVYDEWGLQSPQINDWGSHQLGTLFSSESGYPVIPKFHNHYVYYPHEDKYAALVRIGQIRSFPKDKGGVARGYLRFLWNVLAGANDSLYDSRVVSELTCDRSGFERLQLERIISNSMKREVIAMKKTTADVVAMRRREEAIEARSLLEDQNIPYWCSLGIWLYRDSREQLNQDINDLIQKIPTASVERVWYNIEDYWFQSWPFEWEAFLTKPNHKRQKYIGFQAIPSLPLIKFQQVNKKGMLLVSRELNCPIYLDIANQKNHTIISAKTGGGKSNLMFEMILEYTVNDHLAVVFDFPRPGGRSGYQIFVLILQKLGVKAAYYNVRSSVMNIIEFGDFRHLSAKEREIRWKQTFSNHVRLLQTIVMGTTQNPDREILVKSLLSECYDDFQRQPDIEQRYGEAIIGGFGSEAYERMPILEDFVDYAEKWFSEYQSKKEEQKTTSTLVKDTIGLILTQLRGVLRTDLGVSINGVSSFDTNVSLLIIGLTDVGENLDSLIYAMSGLNVLFRQSLSVERSLFAVDEGTILYKFPFFARQVGIIPVHGRKWGCNFLLAAQEIETVKNSCTGPETLKNIDNLFCGHIKEAAIPELLELDFRADILKPYISEAFKPNAELLQSYWYLKRGEQHLEVVHPASELLLALGATDPDEDAARSRVMASYPNDEITGLKQFASLYAQAKRLGLPMESILPNEKNNGQWTIDN